MAEQDKRRGSIGLILGGLLAIAIIGLIAAWMNWGKPVDGVDESPDAVVQPVGAATPG